MRRRWAALPFWTAWVVSALAFFTPAPELPSGPQVSDKVEHAAIFVVLAVTGRIAGHTWPTLLAALVGYAVLSEVLQALLPIQRDGDWHDALADSIGVVLGLGLVAVCARLRPGRAAGAGR